MPAAPPRRLLARLGVRALIIEGIPKEDKWYSLHVTVDGVTIQEETELIGKGNFAVIEALKLVSARKSASSPLARPANSR